MRHGELAGEAAVAAFDTPQGHDEARLYDEVSRDAVQQLMMLTHQCAPALDPCRRQHTAVIVSEGQTALRLPLVALDHLGARAVIFHLVGGLV